MPDDKIIEAHGSFAAQRCIDCKQPFDSDMMKQMILAKETPRCESPGCGGLVKPDIVFFGEALPDEFIRAIPNVAKADLLIIMGTSMTVHPFAGLSERAGPHCPRVLINLDRVGSIGRRPNDVVLLGKCDEVVRELSKKLGWEKELDALWAKTEMKAPWQGAEDEDEDAEGEEEGDKEATTAEDLVETITDAIGKKLNLEESEAKTADTATSAPAKEQKEDVALKDDAKADPVDSTGKL